MGSNETPAWFDPSSEPEEQHNSADLPPWLREEAPAQPPVPSAPKPDEEDAKLPPWLRRPDQERDMLRGAKLSEDWLSDADSLVESVDTEQTYDNWLAMQKERARPKSIEEEMPDLLSDLPPESAPAATGPLGATGELPDWFLGLEELDTSDAPDWFVGASEPQQVKKTDDQPTWINDLAQAQAEEPPAEDPVDDFFGSLNHASTLPSGASIDELFGEFAASAPVSDEEELPDLNWITGQPEAPSEAAGYGAAEMDSFFSSLGKAASPAPAPSPAPKEAAPDSGSVLRALPIEPESEEEDLPEPDWMPSPSQTRVLGNPIRSVEDFAMSDDDDDEIEEPDLEWFIKPPASTADDLPDIEIEPQAPAPAAEDDYNPDTINWLSELEGIVSAVTREDELAKADPEDFYPQAQPEGPMDTEPVAGRGDEFNWPEPAPYEEQGQDETVPSEPLGMTGRLMPMSGDIDARLPQAPKLTGMLNRMREEEEAKIPDPVVEPSTPEDDLEALLLTEDLLSQGDNTQFAAFNDDDLFASAADHTPEPAPSSSEWGEDFDLDSIIGAASSVAAVEPEPAVNDEEEELSFDDLFAPATSAASSADAASLDDALSFDDLLAMQSGPPSSASDEPESEPVPERTPRFSGLLDRISREVYDENDEPQAVTDENAAEAALDYETLFDSVSPETPPVSEAQPVEEWMDEAPELADDSGFLDTLDGPASEDAEEGEAFADMSWLTDDIFAETGSTTPAESSSPAPDSDEPRDEVEEAAAPLAASVDERSAADFLTTLFEQPRADEQTVLGSQAQAWDSDDAEADDALAAEQAEDTFVWLQFEDQDSTGTAEEPDVRDDDLDEQPLAAALDEDLLAALNPEAVPTPPPAAMTGFDDDFLASLDTLDQMQASGQSQVGENLFAGWDEPPAERPAEGFVPAPGTDAEPPAIDDEFLATLQADEPETAEEAAQTGESPSWMKAETAQESDLPDDFLAALQTVETPRTPAQSQFEPEFEASWQTDEDEISQPQAAELSGFDDDFFAALQSDETDEQEADAQSFAAPQAESPAASEDDFFREMGMNSVTAEAEQQPEFDWLAAVPGVDSTQTPDDPFRTFEPSQPEAAEQPEWLTELNAGQENVDQWFDREAQAQGVEIVAPADDDWLAQFNPLSEADEPAPQNKLPQTGPIEDLDSYIASLTDDKSELRPSTQALLARENVDFDTMLDEPLMDENAAVAPSPTSPFVMGGEPEITEDWLSDVQASVGEVSAGAIVRQRKDRPEGELDSRLKKLRRRGEKVPAAPDEPASDSLADVLPDIDETLAAAPIRTGKPSVMGGLALTPDQQNRVILLKSLVSTNGEEAPPKRLSAIEMTYDTPYMPGLEEDEPGSDERPGKKAVSAKSRRRRPARRFRPDRLLVTLLLAAAVAGPFILPQLRIGDLPPPAFVVGSAQEAAFASLDGLRPGSLVLFAVEYSPAAAAELDPMTDALLRHVLLQNAYPVVISGNPLALLRVSNLFENISSDSAFLRRIGAQRALAANADYYLVQFIPGSTIGLRALGADTARLLMNDLRGQASGLTVRSLRDFPVIVVVADRAEDVRSYAEQIAPLARASVVAAVSYSAAPLVEPYVNATLLGAPASLRGLLVGYGDAYTYSTLIGSVPAIERGPRRAAPVLLTTPDATPTPMPSPTPLFTPTPAPIGTAVVNASQTINVRPEANTNGAPIAQLQPGDEVIVLGFNDDESWVNVRLDDGRDGWVSAQLVNVESDQSAAPKGNTTAKRSAAASYPAGGLDNAWFASLSVDVNLRNNADITVGTRHRRVRENEPTDPINADSQNYTDIVGTRYIVSAALKPRGHDNVVSLLHRMVYQPPSRPSSKTPAKFVGASSQPRQDEAETEEPSPTVRPTRTPRSPGRPTLEDAATPEVTPEAGAAAAFTLPPHSPGYRDERWYAMTLGIIVSAAVISFGAVLNIVRSILRRRR
jgi:hypothetical protein